MTTDEKAVVEVKPSENVKVERTALFIKTISVTYGRKFNLDNYESATLDVTMWADRAEGGDVETDFATLWGTAREQVKATAIPLLKLRDAKRAPKVDGTPPATNSKPAPSMARSPGTPTTVMLPTAPRVITTLLPGQAPPKVGQDKVETFLVDFVTALVTPNGNRNYAVRGGRVKKHGATMWPEVAEALEQITGYDPENLEIGQPWDVASFNITATAEIPEGKRYPTKVISLIRGNGG